MNTPESARMEIRIPGPSRKPFVLLGLFVAMILAGGIGLFIGHGLDPQRFWTAYLVNFLFFLGIGAGGVLFGAVIHMASGRWGRNVKRIADGLGLFLPVSLVLFVIMIPAWKHILPWVENPYGPEGWHDLPFVIARNVIALGALTLLGLYMIIKSVRLDLGLANECGYTYTGPIARLITRNWKGIDAESQTARRRLGVCAPIFTVGFASVLTLISMDFIMSLKTGWYSTLIGGYYFAGCFYTALAALLLATILTRSRFSLGDQIRSNHLHDIAKLTMAFGIVTGDFFYSQLMLIWYGNLPVETSFILDRWHGTPWRMVGIAILLLCFVLPLVAMLNRSLKEKSAPMIVFSLAVLGGMWTERFFLVAPSIMGKDRIHFGGPEILVTLGFLGLLGLVFTVFIHRVPPVVLRESILDPEEAST